MNPIKHVAIIMDGNGRWGLLNKNSRNAGHQAGLKAIEKIIIDTLKYKVRYLTLYTFSTENWKRPKKEIHFLFSLLEKFLAQKINELIKNGIKLKIIGDKKKLSRKLQKLLIDSERKTSHNTSLQINLALNYGSKEEIINAFKKINKKNELLKKVLKKIYIQVVSLILIF